MDYIFRWLAIKFLPGQAQPAVEANGSSLNSPGNRQATNHRHWGARHGIS